MTTVHTLCAKENSALQQHQNDQEIKTNFDNKHVKRNFEILVVTKGAPEAVIEKCDRIKAGDNIQNAKIEHKQEIIQANNTLASNGLRVIGVAFKRQSVDEQIYKNIIENNMDTSLDSFKATHYTSTPNTVAYSSSCSVAI